MNKANVLVIVVGVVAGILVNAKRELNQRDERALGRFTYNWLESREVMPEQCNSYQVKLVERSYDYVAPLAEHDYPELHAFYEEMIRRTTWQCNQLFHKLAEKVLDECRPQSDCGKATANYKITSRWTKKDVIGLAVRLGEIMKENLGHDASVDEFENEFKERGPCKRVFDLLEQDYMGNYTKFLSLISRPEYYPRFDEVNQKAADAVAACRYLQSAEGLMERAYDVYSIISIDSIDTNLQRLGDLLFSLDVENSLVSRSSDQANPSTYGGLEYESGEPSLSTRDPEHKSTATAER